MSRRPAVIRVARWILPTVIVVEVGLVLSGVIDLRQGVAAALVIEASLAGLVAFEIVLVVRAVRAARAADIDFPFAVERGLTAVMPDRLARFARHDLMLIRALWLATRRRCDVRRGELAIGYAKPMMLLLWVVLVVDGTLVALLHLTVPWEAVRAALLVLGIAGAVWLAGFIASLRVYPHAVSSHRLRIRFAAMCDYSVPMGAVLGVRKERRVWDVSSSAAVIDDHLVVPISNQTDLVVDIDPAVPLRTYRSGTGPTVKAICFAADDATSAIADIQALLSPSR